MKPHSTVIFDPIFIKRRQELAPFFLQIQKAIQEPVHIRIVHVGWLDCDRQVDTVAPCLVLESKPDENGAMETTSADLYIGPRYRIVFERTTASVFISKLRRTVERVKESKSELGKILIGILDEQYMFSTNTLTLSIGGAVTVRK